MADPHTDLRIQIFEEMVQVTFSDRGDYFNPLEKVLTGYDYENVKKYRIGGMGITLVSRLMDDVLYSRENGENVLAIIKQY